MPNRKLKNQNKTGISLTPEQMQALSHVEDVSSAAMQTSQQVLLAFETILQQDFNFKTADLEHVRDKLTVMLQTLAHIEDKGILTLSPVDIAVIGTLAGNKLKRIKAEEGIILPEKI